MARGRNDAERLFYAMSELAKEAGFNLDEVQLTAIPSQGIHCSTEIVLRRYGAEVDQMTL